MAKVSARFGIPTIAADVGKNKLESLADGAYSVRERIVDDAFFADFVLFPCPQYLVAEIGAFTEDRLRHDSRFGTWRSDVAREKLTRVVRIGQDTVRPRIKVDAFLVLLLWSVAASELVRLAR